jgi:holo-[acyl-carrier-protein] synthase
VISGVGIDIVGIERIKYIVENYGERFLNRVFSPTELNNIYKIKNKGNIEQKIAGFFAAKEAFLKSLHIGLFSIPLNCIKISNKQNGAPFLRIDDKIKKFILDTYNINIGTINLSISHDNGSAIAIVIIENM